MFFQQRSSLYLPVPLTKSSPPPVSSAIRTPHRGNVAESSTYLGHALKSPDSESCAFTTSHFLLSKTVILPSAGPCQPIPNPQTNCRKFLTNLPASWSLLLQTSLNTPVMFLKPQCAHITAQLKHPQWLSPAHLFNLAFKIQTSFQ